MLRHVNAPRFGSCEIRGLANWGPFPNAAVIVEADQKLSSGGEGRLTRDNYVKQNLNFPSFHPGERVTVERPETERKAHKWPVHVPLCPSSTELVAAPRNTRHSRSMVLYHPCTAPLIRLSSGGFRRGNDID